VELDPRFTCSLSRIHSETKLKRKVSAGIFFTTDYVLANDRISSLSEKAVHHGLRILEAGLNLTDVTKVHLAVAFALPAISTYSYHPRGTYISTPSNPHRLVASDRTLLNAANVGARKSATTPSRLS
jgi:hypothetical protein